MPHVRIAHRAAAVRPPLPNPGGNLRAPIPRAHNPRGVTPHRFPAAVRNRVPQYLPVLQPPTFPREIEYYEEEQQDQYYEQYQEEYYAYPTVPILDQQGAVEDSTEIPTRFLSSIQKLSFQPLARLSNRYYTRQF